MRIWDIHCHPTGPRVPGRGLTEKIENLIPIAARVGIERLGLFLPVGKSAEEDREIARVLETHRQHVFGLVWLSLWEASTARNLDTVNRWVADGPMVGLKFGGHSGICSLPVYDPIYARAEELQALVYQHTWIKVGGQPPHPGGGNLRQESRPEDVVIRARRQPELRIICGHTGGDWELGVRAVAASARVPVETGGGFPARGQVEMAVRELGADRVIYGSDISGRGFASQLGKVHGAGIAEADKEKIFSGNLIRLLRPMLRKKGLPL